jgi:hypothetical protein
MPVMLAPNDEGVDVRGALVGHDRLEVVHVPDHGILERDPARPKDLARGPGDVERGVHVRKLAHAHVLGAEAAAVLQASRCSASRVARLTSTAMCASLPWTSWKAAIGLENWILSFAWLSAAS